MKQILGEAKDTSDRYVARAIVEERVIMPGYRFYVEIQRDGDPRVKKVKVGKMSAGAFGLINYPPVWQGVYGIEDMYFDKEGLTINFLKGLWGPGLEGMLNEEQINISRNRFN